MMCVGFALSTLAQGLRVTVLILLLVQLAFGIALTIFGFLIFFEAAPDKPDQDEERKLEAAISLFYYAGEVKQYTESSLAKSCVTLMVTGVLLSGFAILGFSSIASSRPKFLLVFLAALVVSGTASVYISTSISTYKERSVKSLQELMQWTLTTQYDGNLNSTNRWSRLWDLGQITFHCCGIKNWKDFEDSKNYEKIYLGPEVGVSSMSPGLYHTTIPLTCCKIEEGYGLDLFNSIKTGKLERRGTFVLLDEGCITSPDSTNSNMETGCEEALKNLVQKYGVIIKVLSQTSVAFMVFLQLGVILIIYTIID